MKLKKFIKHWALAGLMLFIVDSLSAQNDIVKSISLNNIGNYEASLGKGQAVYPLYPRNLKGSDSIITFLDQNNGIIKFLNVFTGRYTDSINIQFRYGQKVQGYYIQNEDTIIVSIVASYLRDFHDSSIFITN